MAKRKSAYENEYTRKMEEAVFDQEGYDNRKTEKKKQFQEHTKRQKSLLRIFYFLCLLFVAVVSYLVLSNPNNQWIAAPLVVFLTGCAGVYFFVRWLHKG